MDEKMMEVGCMSKSKMKMKMNFKRFFHGAPEKNLLNEKQLLSSPSSCTNPTLSKPRNIHKNVSRNPL
jgi:hypothetical protein